MGRDPAVSATLCARCGPSSATRYVTPLREGGSLPGLVEADDDGLYVVKFRGAGQGPRALVAEWLAGELGPGRSGWPCRTSWPWSWTRRSATPSRTRRSRTSCGPAAGRNLGIDFLPGALMFNPASATSLAAIDPVTSPRTSSGSTASSRTPTASSRTRTCSSGTAGPWLIDHGASLYIHHTWRDPDAHARRPFERIRRPRAAAVRRFARRRRRAARAAGSTVTPSLTTSSSSSPTPGCRTTRSRGDAAAQRRPLRRYLDAATGGAAPVRRGGGACPSRRVTSSSTRSSASCRASSAASS